MENFTINIANINIGISCIHDFTRDFCKDYVVVGEPDFIVSSSDDKIDREIELSDFTPARGYAESICVYREIAERLPLYNRCVFHGASIEYDDRGYIFTAVSGTGKSTHIKLWQRYLGEDKVKIINGDKPVLHITENGVTVYSTPYAGKEGWQNHSSAPLSAICVLRRGEKNKISRVNPKELLVEVFNQVYRPKDTQSAVKTLDLLSQLLKLPVYVLECDISEEAVKTSFEALTNLSYDERRIK